MDGAVEVYREPADDGYGIVTLHRPGGVVSSLAFPDVTFAVTDFFA
jgi:Uma2 family endonuclease